MKLSLFLKEVFMFSPVMYYDEYAYSNQKSIKRSFKKKKFKDNFYVCALSDFDKRVEFYCADMLNQDFYRQNDVYVIGLCKNEESAMTLITNMVHNCMNSCGNLDFQTYFDKMIMQHDNKIDIIVDSEGRESVRYS